MKKYSPVVHFEMPAKDKKRVVEFYSKVFDWDMMQLGAEMSNYILAGTTPTDENQMAQKPGEINGGFFEYANKKGLNAPHVVIQVENLDEAMKKVKNSGGKINDMPFEIQGIGIYASITDSEDNIVGMLEPPKEQK